MPRVVCEEQWARRIRRQMVKWNQLQVRSDALLLHTISKVFSARLSSAFEDRSTPLPRPSYVRAKASFLPLHLGKKPCLWGSLVMEQPVPGRQGQQMRATASLASLQGLPTEAKRVNQFF